MLIREHLFRGEIPAAAAQHLPEGAAQTSKNAVREGGNIRPLKDTLAVNTPSKAGTKKAIHLFAGSFWFHWITEVDAVRAPVPNDTQERTVFTGDGAPKVTDASIATSGGGTLYPNNSYLLGIPAPTAAPTVAVQGASTDPADAESTAYVETFLRRWSGIDEEGPPSPASNIVDAEFVNGQSVALSALNAAPVGGYGITHRRIYRRVTASGSYQFVREEAIATLGCTDSALTSALGEAIETEEYSPPPSDLTGIRAMPNGVLVGFSGKNVCFCEPYQAHAWPTRYRLPSDFDIVGVEVFGSSVLVATEGVPYVSTGTQPGYMSMDRTEIAQACVSRRGMADLGSAVAYPSPDGLMLIGSGIAENATRNLFTREQWLAMKPSSFIAAAHDSKYYAFYDTGTAQGCIILDLTDGSLDRCDIAATAAHVDLLTDTLYIQRGDDIVKWEGGGSLTLTRKSKRFDLPRPACFTAARVKAAAYPLTLKLYAKMESSDAATAAAAASEGLLTASGDRVIRTATVTDGKPFRLPGNYRAEAAEIEVSGSAGAIEEIVLAETMSELRRI